MTDAVYSTNRYGVFTKRCEARSVCEAKLNEDKCKTRIPDPSCVYCCDTPYCNYNVPMPTLYQGNCTCSQSWGKLGQMSVQILPFKIAYDIP